MREFQKNRLQVSVLGGVVGTRYLPTEVFFEAQPQSVVATQPSSLAIQTPAPVSPRQLRLEHITQISSRFLMQALLMKAQKEGYELSENQLRNQVETNLNLLFRSYQVSRSVFDLDSVRQAQTGFLPGLLQSNLPVHRAFSLYLQSVSNLDLSEREYQQAQIQFIRSLAHESGGSASDLIQMASSLWRTMRGAVWSVQQNNFEQALYRLSDRCEKWMDSSESASQAQENESYLEFANSVVRQLLHEIPDSELEQRQFLNQLLQEEIPWRAGERELSQILREHSLVFCRSGWEAATPVIGMIAALGGGWCGLIAKNRLLSAVIGGAANGGIQTGLQLVRQLMQQGKLQGPSVEMQAVQSLSTGAACGIVAHSLGFVFFRLHQNSWLGRLGSSGIRELRFGLKYIVEKPFRFVADIGSEIGCDDLWGNRNIQNRMGIHNAPHPPLILRGGADSLLPREGEGARRADEGSDQEDEQIQTHPFFKWVNNAAGELCGDLFGDMAHHYSPRFFHFDQSIQVSRILQDYAPVFEHFGNMQTDAHQTLVAFLQAYEGDGGNREELIERALQLVVSTKASAPSVFSGDSDLHPNNTEVSHQLLSVMDIQTAIHALGSDISFEAAKQSIEQHTELFFSKANFTNRSEKMTQLVEGYFASIFSFKKQKEALESAVNLGFRLEKLWLYRAGESVAKLQTTKLEGLLQNILFNKKGPVSNTRKSLKFLEKNYADRNEKSIFRTFAEKVFRLRKKPVFSSSIVSGLAAGFAVFLDVSSNVAEAAHSLRALVSSQGHDLPIHPGQALGTVLFFGALSVLVGGIGKIVGDVEGALSSTETGASARAYLDSVQTPAADMLGLNEVRRINYSRLKKFCNNLKWKHQEVFHSVSESFANIKLPEHSLLKISLELEIARRKIIVKLRRLNGTLDIWRLRAIVSSLREEGEEEFNLVEDALQNFPDLHSDAHIQALHSIAFDFVLADLLEKDLNHFVQELECHSVQYLLGRLFFKEVFLDSASRSIAGNVDFSSGNAAFAFLQIVEVLIENALKQGEDVGFQLEWVENEGLQVTVQDRGKGIDSNYIVHLAQEASLLTLKDIEKIDDHKLARAIVILRDLCWSSLYVFSRVEEGSQFRFVIPPEQLQWRGDVEPALFTRRVEEAVRRERLRNEEFVELHRPAALKVVRKARHPSPDESAKLIEKIGNPLLPTNPYSSEKTSNGTRYLDFSLQEVSLSQLLHLLRMISSSSSTEQKEILSVLSQKVRSFFDMKTKALERSGLGFEIDLLVLAACQSGVLTKSEELQTSGLNLGEAREKTTEKSQTKIKKINWHVYPQEEFLESSVEEFWKIYKKLLDEKNNSEVTEY